MLGSGKDLTFASLALSVLRSNSGDSCVAPCDTYLDIQEVSYAFRIALLI